MRQALTKTLKLKLNYCKFKGLTLIKILKSSSIWLKFIWLNYILYMINIYIKVNIWKYMIKVYDL